MRFVKANGNKTYPLKDVLAADDADTDYYSGDNLTSADSNIITQFKNASEGLKTVIYYSCCIHISHYLIISPSDSFLSRLSSPGGLFCLTKKTVIWYPNIVRQ